LYSATSRLAVFGPAHRHRHLPTGHRLTHPAGPSLDEIVPGAGQGLFAVAFDDQTGIVVICRSAGRATPVPVQPAAPG